MAKALPKGMYCLNPECHSGDVTNVARRRPAAGMKVRYFRCNTCGCRFNSTERLGKVTKAPWNRRESGTAS